MSAALDHQVAEAMKWIKTPNNLWWLDNEGTYQAIPCFNPSTDIGQCFQYLIPYAKKHGGWLLTVEAFRSFWVAFFHVVQESKSTSISEDAYPSVAICMAFLEAMEIDALAQWLKGGKPEVEE